MSAHELYGLTRVINAHGTYTPLGVSRSTENVRRAVCEALSDFFVIEELQATASRVISELTGARAGAVVHCTSAGISLAVAATMTGLSIEMIRALPDTAGMSNRVILPAGHAVDYGHPIVQDIRLAGARPVLAGFEDACSIDQLEESMSVDRAACLLLVSSRLTRGESIPMREAVSSAHRHGLPAIIDGAAQDMRIDELLATGADLLLVSAQKYLAGPPAGLVLGDPELVAAVRAQEKGIGRSMKATKEGILGALAALTDRKDFDLADWRNRQEQKVLEFVRHAGRLPGVSASVDPDKAGMPFPRACLAIDPTSAGMDAASLVEKLRAGEPSIWVMLSGDTQGTLVLELVPLEAEEIGIILSRLASILVR